MKNNKKILITTGDVNGIGAEITLKALKNFNPDDIAIISNKDILSYYGNIPDIEIIEIDYPKQKIQPSKLTRESGDFSFRCLKKACELVQTKKYSSIVTAPVSKEALLLAGHYFSGQTEILEHFLGHDSQKAEMLFVAKKFRILLLTRHVALKQINLTSKTVYEKIYNLNRFLKTKLNISNPKIALCAFNPHASENGMFGNEEKEILFPAVESLRNNDVNITNPLPADTLFVSAGKSYIAGKFEEIPYDCYVACYHDQGLLPIKTVAYDDTVNMTIGLDVIRTSPAHGTAFDIAGKNIANEKSMISAIEAALSFN